MRILFATLTSLLFLSAEKIATTTSLPIKDGIWNGHYVSYYHNGTKKAEGEFKNNQRIGNWIVWDSLGQKKAERFYRNNFDCDHISEMYKGDGEGLMMKYGLSNNKDGYIDYSPLKEKAVMCTKRVWRTIDHSELNATIYWNDDTLWTFLRQLIIDGEITIYDPKDDEFTTEIVQDSDPELSPPKDSFICFTGFQIKEDWFYDSERKISETRLIGICLMGKTKKSPKDGKPLFWIYYPEIRKLMASFKLNYKTLPSNIKTMDDLFFFRYFNSTIYKQTNLKDQELKDYCKTPEEIKKENIRIENEMLDMEHNVWMDEKYYARPPK